MPFHHYLLFLLAKNRVLWLHQWQRRQPKGDACVLELGHLQSERRHFLVQQLPVFLSQKARFMTLDREMVRCSSAFKPPTVPLVYKTAQQIFRTNATHLPLHFSHVRPQCHYFLLQNLQRLQLPQPRPSRSQHAHVNLPLHVNWRCRENWCWTKLPLHLFLVINSKSLARGLAAFSLSADASASSLSFCSSLCLRAARAAKVAFRRCISISSEKGCAWASFEGRGRHFEDDAGVLADRRTGMSATMDSTPSLLSFKFCKMRYRDGCARLGSDISAEGARSSPRTINSSHRTCGACNQCAMANILIAIVPTQASLFLCKCTVSRQCVASGCVMRIRALSARLLPPRPQG
ncbi:hypothetical protein C8R45DRAFT_259525 [Mycena sanguinolenta]|nr:hypothetical protein C8R45DRAFT_259525 [Mycena sanguinolenta]